MSIATWLSFGFLAAGIIHVAEEYFGGFLQYTRRFLAGFSAAHFWFINTLFIVLCGLAAFLPGDHPVLRLTIAGLILINALIHIAASLRLRVYSPGLITAVLFYLPLSITAFVLALRQGSAGGRQALAGLALGMACMLVPPLFQGVRILIQRRAAAHRTR